MVMTVHPGQWAAAYRRLGWMPVPCHPGAKAPRVPWADVPDGHAFAWRRTDNLALRQGPGTGIALDVDGPEAWGWLLRRFPAVPWESLPQVETGSGGRHVYAPYPDAWRPLAAHGVSRVVLWHGAPGAHDEVSVHLSRSLTLAPPSRHPNGRPYVWRVPPRTPLPVLTDPALLQAVLAAAAPPPPPAPRAIRLPAAGPERGLAWLARRGLTPHTVRPGRDRWYLYLRCPWAAGHSTPDDGTATAVFWSPHAVGFRCLHAHCRQRTWADLAALPVLPGSAAG